MAMSYEEWHTQTAAILLDSHVPKAFIEEHLANRPVMYKLYEDGFTANEVLTHLLTKYQAQKSKRNRERFRQWALVLLAALMVPLVCLFTFGVTHRLSGVFGSVEDFLVFALIPFGMCVLPFVVMAIFWMKTR